MTVKKPFIIGKNLKIYGFSCKKKKTLKALKTNPKGNKVII